MTHASLTSELPWQRNEAITFLPTFAFLGTKIFFFLTSLVSMLYSKQGPRKGLRSSQIIPF